MRLVQSLAVGFACGLSASAAADVLIVDASGGGNFVHIQAAIDAANEGDTILVKSGTYRSFLIIKKKVDVIADTNAVVQIVGAVRVGSLDVDQTVVLSGLKVKGRLTGDGVDTDGLYVRNTLSSVRVQDCELHAYEPNQNLNNEHCHGAELESVDDIAFVRCDLRGSAFHWSSYEGGDGLHARDSNVAAYDCGLYGAPGKTLNNGYGQRGGDGFDGRNCFFFASGSLLSGARGGDADCYFGYGIGGNGGDGVFMHGPFSSAQLLDDTLSFGDGGNLCCGYACGVNGSSGQATHTLHGGSVTQIRGNSRTMSMANPVRELQPVPITIFAQPGDKAYLYITRAPGFVFDPPFNGVQLTKQSYPPKIKILGQVAPNGSMTTGILFTDLGTGVQSFNWFLQVYTRDAQGQSTLGSPAMVTVLDQAF